MAQAAHIGNGIKVAYATGSPHTWNKLELVTDVKIPTLEPDVLDSTLSSTSGFKRSFNGMTGVSDCEVTMQRDNYSSTSPNQNALYDLLAAGTQVWWRVEIPADPNLATSLYEAFEFQGRVGSFAPTAQVKAKQEVMAKIRFDGASFTRQEPYASVIG